MKDGGMNAERLLALYERVADAPDAVARLRRLVLDLAVRGKLVQQDPNDEPASELLERIMVEKERLVNEGELKKSKRMPPLVEPPFGLPTTWIWTRLGAIATYLQRGKSPQYATGEGSPVISQKCVQWTGLDLTLARQITLDSLAKYEPIRFLCDGDLLWNSTGTGTIGRVVRVTPPIPKLVCDSHVTVVRCLEVDPEYVRTWLRSDHVYGAIEERAAGSTNQVELTAQIANNQPVPLPPLAEQRRIVAKVDELMALLDRLEAARTEQEATRDRLTTASLARLTAPDTTVETFPAHARFAIDALPALTTRADQIKTLRQTILNLAVRGKLVPQDPTDEPAFALFKRIHTLKAMNVQPGEMNREARFASVREAPPFELPKTWLGVCLREIAHNLGDGLHGTPEYSSDGECFFINGNNLREGKILLHGNTKRVSSEECAKHAKPLSDNTVLVSINGTLGNIAFYRGESVMLGKSACYFELSPLVLKEYLKVLIQSPYYMDYAFTNATGTTIKNLSLKAMNSFPVPLPPLPEQHRIVAKVDALMALCDRLVAALTTIDMTKQRLLETLIQEALTDNASNKEAA